MGEKRVILAYSGGIDSNAAINILLGEGYGVTALMLQLTTSDQGAIEKARARAEELGVEFVTIDCRDRFQDKIINNFIDEYIAGRTPAPCTRCNPLIKWHMLMEYAKSVGAEHIATGHYFSVVSHGDKLYVSRALDRRKDQSYYLWGVSQEALSMALTPMANKIKEDIKSLSTLKKESMGICFLHGKHYAELLKEREGSKIQRGEIIDSKGEVVGEHRGLAYYTIGQKRGEGIPPQKAVIGIDAHKNRIVVGEDSELYSRTLIINECNVIDESEWLNAEDITVLVRGLGRNPEGFARIERYRVSGYYTIHLSHPAWACAAGQPVVLYRGDRVIGGGYLVEAL